ncbi:MAG: hypothetical protein WC839_01455 [Candidatus Paceibacterota bacterium]
MNLALKELVDNVLAKRIFDVESLKGYKSKRIQAGICDCDDGDEDGGCSD